MKKIAILCIFVWTLGMSNVCLAVLELSDEEYYQWAKASYFQPKDLTIPKDGIVLDSIVFSRKAADYGSPCYIDICSRGILWHEIIPGPIWLIFDNKDKMELEQVRHKYGKYAGIGFSNDIGLYKVPEEAVKKIQQTTNIKMRFLRNGYKFIEVRLPEVVVDTWRQIIDWKEPEQEEKVS